MNGAHRKRRKVHSSSTLASSFTQPRNEGQFPVFLFTTRKSVIAIVVFWASDTFGRCGSATSVFKCRTTFSRFALVILLFFDEFGPIFNKRPRMSSAGRQVFLNVDYARIWFVHRKRSTGEKNGVCSRPFTTTCALCCGSFLQHVKNWSCQDGSHGRVSGSILVALQHRFPDHGSFVGKVEGVK